MTFFLASSAIAGATQILTGRGPFGAEPESKLTDERRIIFETAMKKLMNPTKLRFLAKAYRKVGCDDQAVQLEQRAEYIYSRTGGSQSKH